MTNIYCINFFFSSFGIGLVIVFTYNSYFHFKISTLAGIKLSILSIITVHIDTLISLAQVICSQCSLLLETLSNKLLSLTIELRTKSITMLQFRQYSVQLSYMDIIVAKSFSLLLDYCKDTSIVRFSFSFQIEDHKKFLKKAVIQIGVGTPNRLNVLLNSGKLSTFLQFSIFSSYLTLLN